MLVELNIVAHAVLHGRLDARLEQWLRQLDEGWAHVERRAHWRLQIVVCAAREVLKTFGGHVDYGANLRLRSLHALLVARGLTDAQKPEPTSKLVSSEITNRAFLTFKAGKRVGMLYNLNLNARENRLETY